MENGREEENEGTLGRKERERRMGKNKGKGRRVCKDRKDMKI